LTGQTVEAYYPGIVKTISITIDEPLLRAIDKAARTARRTRSEVCRVALKAWLSRARHADRVREEHEAYRVHPVGDDEFEGLIAAQAFDDDGEGR
jgi:metal-responsive CopG/Arc/MetJ family transcriptional regulator